MLFKKGQLSIFIVNLISLIAFTPFFIARRNYEFIIYIGVILFFVLLILSTNKKVNYPNVLLWSLTVWGIFHMAGGGILINGVKLYEIMLLPIVQAPYYIFRYDQFVHMVGFGIATFAMYYLIKPLLKEDLEKWTALSIVIIMAGLGVGALNEIIEFFATVILPKTGVGGYENTALDLVANFIGAIVAMTIILLREKPKSDKKIPIWR